MIVLYTLMAAKIIGIGTLILVNVIKIKKNEKNLLK